MTETYRPQLSRPQLSKIEQNESNYRYVPNSNFFKGSYWDTQAQELLFQEKFFDAIPFLKCAMDEHFSIHRSYERETQQIIARENNLPSSSNIKDSVARGTDYYVVGIEYNLSSGGESDIIAVRYTTKSRSGTIGQLSVIEVKYGVGAIDGSSGVEKHIIDVERFFSEKKNLDSLKKESIILFNQKYNLGLLDVAKPIEEIDDGKPEFILILADVIPKSVVIRNLLEPFKDRKFQTFDLKLAFSSSMGYGLYTECIVSVDKFLKKT